MSKFKNLFVIDFNFEELYNFSMEVLKFRSCGMLANNMLLNSYLIIVIFFTLTQFLENKIYTQKTRKLRQNTQKIAHFLRYYGKIHSKLPIFRVKSVKIYTCQKNLH